MWEASIIVTGIPPLGESGEVCLARRRAKRRPEGPAPAIRTCCGVCLVSTDESVREMEV